MMDIEELNMQFKALYSYHCLVNNHTFNIENYTVEQLTGLAGLLNNASRSPNPEIPLFDWIPYIPEKFSNENNEEKEKEEPLCPYFLKLFEEDWLACALSPWRKYWWNKLSAEEKDKWLLPLARWFRDLRSKDPRSSIQCKFYGGCKKGRLLCPWDHYTPIPIHPNSNTKDSGRALWMKITTADVIVYLWNKGLLVDSQSKDVSQFLDNLPPTEDPAFESKTDYLQFVEQEWNTYKTPPRPLETKKEKERRLRNAALEQIRAHRAKREGAKKPQVKRKHAEESAAWFSEASLAEEKRMDEENGRRYAAFRAFRRHYEISCALRTELFEPRRRILPYRVALRIHRQEPAFVGQSSLGKRARDEDESPLPRQRKDFEQSGDILHPGDVHRLRFGHAWTYNSTLGKRTREDEDENSDAPELKRKDTSRVPDYALLLEEVQAADATGADEGENVVEPDAGSKTPVEASLPAAGEPVVRQITKSSDALIESKSASGDDFKPESPIHGEEKTPAQVIGKKRRRSPFVEQSRFESAEPANKKARVDSFTSDELSPFNTSTSSSRVSTPTREIFSRPVSPASSASSRQSAPIEDMATTMKTDSDGETAQDETDNDEIKNTRKTIENKESATAPAQPEAISNTKSTGGNDKSSAVKDQSKSSEVEKPAVAPLQPSNVTQVGSTNPNSAGGNGSDPPPPPKDLKKIPEDAPDVPSSPESGEIRDASKQPELENAKDLGKEGSTIIGYYAAPLTRKEFNELNSGLVKQTAHLTNAQRKPYADKIKKELMTRGLSEDEDPKWREKILKHFRLSPGDLPKPRGNVLS